MESNKSKQKTFDYAMVVKQKKVSLPEYVLLKKAFLEGLMVTKEWLITIKKNNPEYTERIDKVLNHINLETVEYDLRILETLRSPETEDIFKFLDSQIVSRPSVVTRSPLSSNHGMNNINPIFPKPQIVSKEELKIEINQLYQQEDNYDICLTKTSELLQHPDLTEDEKERYQNFYHELLEWVNLKTRDKNETAPRPANQPPSTITVSESRGTAISQLRTDMLKELQKLRNLYIDPSERK